MNTCSPHQVLTIGLQLARVLARRQHAAHAGRQIKNMELQRKRDWTVCGVSSESVAHTSGSGWCLVFSYGLHLTLTWIGKQPLMSCQLARRYSAKSNGTRSQSHGILAQQVVVSSWIRTPSDSMFRPIRHSLFRNNVSQRLFNTERHDAELSMQV